MICRCLYAWALSLDNRPVAQRDKAALAAFMPSSEEV